MKTAILLLCLLSWGCQSVVYRVEVSGDNNMVEIPGSTEIAKPIEISPARSVEARDNTVPIK